MKALQIATPTVIGTDTVTSSRRRQVTGICFLEARRRYICI